VIGFFYRNHQHDHACTTNPGFVSDIAAKYLFKKDVQINVCGFWNVEEPIVLLKIWDWHWTASLLHRDLMGSPDPSMIGVNDNYLHFKGRYDPVENGLKFKSACGNVTMKCKCIPPYSETYL